MVPILSNIAFLILASLSFPMVPERHSTVQAKTSLIIKWGKENIEEREREREIFLSNPLAYNITMVIIITMQTKNVYSRNHTIRIISSS